MFDKFGRYSFSWLTWMRESAAVSAGLALSVLVGLFLLSGCARLQASIDSWRGPGFTDNKESEYVAEIRDQDEEKPSDFGTVTTKGREIERSLGQ
ncbi:MAG: hypothetical protein PHE53_12530 [Thermoguttaceae bacterium]|nr:hypothetical protein [Thermoguttaceae bacterium]